MVESIEIAEFLKLQGVMLDVRSPAEFTQGRIPGARNVPLLTDEERAIVGTVYKEQGSQAAIELGMKIAGPKLGSLVASAKEAVQQQLAKVFCWRGGMRSSSMAWLLRTAGLEAVSLKGGYKAFRRWVLKSFTSPKPIALVGGLTGTGKTAILQALKGQGEQILDLESLACHRGSSYGMIGMPPQPSTEQFENEIALQMAAFDSRRPVWIEDESRLVGRCQVPKPLFLQMRQAPLFLVERPFPERLGQLKADYFGAPRQLLIEATERISKKLGGARTREVVRWIEEGKLDLAMESVLQYYDGTYLEGLKGRQQTQHRCEASGLSDEEWATKLRQMYAETVSA